MDKEVVSQGKEDQGVIRLKGVYKKYRLYNSKLDRVIEALHPLRKNYHKDFYALKNIDLEVRKGEILGIIGKNGSGKTTLLKTISGVVTPTSGTVNTTGNIVPLLQLGSGFNPEYTGLENIFFYSSVLGYNKSKIRGKVDEIIDFADIGDYLYQPLRTYSTGMRARLAFAVSINIEPDILMLDEILAVGDELFRRKCYAKMKEIFESGKTILFVSHAMNVVNEICNRAVFLDRGEKIMVGDARLVTMYYQKYLYSNDYSIQDLRDELRELETRGDGRALQERVVPAHDQISGLISEDEQIREKRFEPQPFFIPDLRPSSTSITRNAQVDIDQIHIETMDGQSVNVLVMNQEYLFRFRVRFMEEVRKIRFSVALTSMVGILVTYEIFPLKNEPVETIPAGSQSLVTWRFTCLLRAGNYFMEAGVMSYESPESRHLIRIQDAMVFKVLEEQSHDAGGFVDLNQQMSFEMIQDTP